jgi:hypothetical protein
MRSGHNADQNTNSLPKIECKNVAILPSTIFGNIVGQNTNSLQNTDFKNVAKSKTKPWSLAGVWLDSTLRNLKQKKVQNSLNYGRKTNFSAILKIFDYSRISL